MLKWEINGWDSISIQKLKVSKSRKQICNGFLNSLKKRTKLTILSMLFTHDSEELKKKSFAFEIAWPLAVRT